jgi:hypothetical protein
MTYCFDIDGTVCTNTEGDYERAEPLPEVIARINALYDAGHRIKLFTARGTVTGIDWQQTTERQCKAWGLSYHELLFKKPQADLYIDDRGINVKDWMRNG